MSLLFEVIIAIGLGWFGVGIEGLNMLEHKKLAEKTDVGVVEYVPLPVELSPENDSE